MSKNNAYTLRIDSLKISNIFSFEYKDAIEDCSNLILDPSFNIIIGPNGSGKSNFVEILNQIFKKILIKPYKLFEEAFQHHNNDPNYSLQNVIQANEVPLTLLKNNQTPMTKMHIRVHLVMSNDDLDNLKFIMENLVELKKLLTEYSPFHGVLDPFENQQVEKMGPHRIIVDLVKESNQAFVILYDAQNLAITRMISYIQYFNILQYLISLGRSRHNYNWNYLKNTFVMIGSNRNYDTIGSAYSLQDNPLSKETEHLTSILKENTKQSTAPIPSMITYVKHKIFHYYDKCINEEISSTNTQGDLKKAKEKLEEFEPYKSIKKNIGSILELDLNVERSSNGYEFVFKDNNNKIVRTDELSTGEKGVFHFIVSILGYDIYNGLIVIDEPELHLHPKLHMKYLDLLLYIQKEYSTQIVIITHSVYFINSNTIRNTIRFFKDKTGYTNWVNPELDDADMYILKILDITNSSKIFFTRSVVLVEGPDDEYFYNYFANICKDYFRYVLMGGQQVTKMDVDFEIIEMGGKKGYNNWMKLLNKFRIDCHYIGDFDNIFNLDILSKTTQTALDAEKRNFKNSTVMTNLINNNIIKQTNGVIEEDEDFSSEFLIFIHNKSISLTIRSDMDKKYNEKIYILKDGALEDYLGINKKNKNNREQIIQFCNKPINSTLTNLTMNKNLKTEMLVIFSRIMSFPLQKYTLNL